MKLNTYKSLEEVSNIEDAGGVVLHYFLMALDDCFHKTSYEKVKNFFKRNNHYRKWMIFSDYVLHDKDKKNDVLVFSILPAIYDFQEFGNYINIWYWSEKYAEVK